ncbi:MAG: glycosyltransferase family 2 protein [Flavobacteriales bacterium]
MKFSVVIPSYNRAEFLPKTLESIFNQTHHAHEIIVVDDGSTDDSALLVKELIKSHGNLILINQQNSERGRARNVGWAGATGDYVVFFDSDDQMLPHYLETLDREIGKQPVSPEIVACKIHLIKDGQISSHRSQNGLEGKYNYKLFLKGNPLACHFAVKREVPFIQFNEDRSLATMEDWMFLVENTMNREMIVIDEVAIQMVEHGGRSMHQNDELITRRLRAANLLKSKLNFNSLEERKLNAYTHLFCFIHSVDGRSIKKALFHLSQCLKYGLIDSVVLYTLVRLTLGDKLIRVFR